MRFLELLLVNVSCMVILLAFVQVYGIFYRKSAIERTLERVKAYLAHVAHVTTKEYNHTSNLDPVNALKEIEHRLESARLSDIEDAEPWIELIRIYADKKRRLRNQLS